MQLNLESSTAKYQIKQYATGCVTVNEQEYTHPLLIMPEYLAPWTVANLAAITAQHIAELCQLQPSLIIIGVGEQQAFLPTEVLQPARDRGIGVEIMTTAAACRTYTILVSEHRNVLAALII